MTATHETGTIDELCDVEYGTRVVRKRDAGSTYPVYGGGGETFYLDSFNRENRVVIARFAMSEKCTRKVLGKFALNDSGLTLSPKNTESLRQDYLDYWTLNLNDVIYEKARGTAQKNLDMPTFRKMQLTFPKSIKIQKLIVEKLDKAFAEIDSLEKNLQSKEERTNKLLQSMLSSAFNNTDEFDMKVVKLKDVVSIERGSSFNSGIYIGLEDIEAQTGKYIGNFVPRKVKSLTFNFTSQHLLYGRLRPYLNKVLLPSFSGHCSTEIFPIMTGESLQRDYLFYWLTYSTTVEKINRTATGTRMPRADMNKFLDLDFYLPELSKQQKIVEKLKTAFAEIDKLRNQIFIEKERISSLRQSILSNAFNFEEQAA